MLQDFFLNSIWPHPQKNWTNSLSSTWLDGPILSSSPIQNHKGTKVIHPLMSNKVKSTYNLHCKSILRLKRQGSRRWGRSTPTWLDGLILSKSPSGKNGLLPRKKVASLTPSGPESTRSKRGWLKRSTMAMINPSTIICTG